MSESENKELLTLGSNHSASGTLCICWLIAIVFGIIGFVNGGIQISFNNTTVGAALMGALGGCCVILCFLGALYYIFGYDSKFYYNRESNRFVTVQKNLFKKDKFIEYDEKECIPRLQFLYTPSGKKHPPHLNILLFLYYEKTETADLLFYLARIRSPHTGKENLKDTPMEHLFVILQSFVLKKEDISQKLYEMVLRKEDTIDMNATQNSPETLEDIRVMLAEVSEFEIVNQENEQRERFSFRKNVPQPSAPPIEVVVENASGPQLDNQ